jgi:hypothetical protein
MVLNALDRRANGRSARRSGGGNPQGQSEPVRYEQINAILLNEFLTEHRKGEELDCKIQQQETTIASNP